MFHNLTLLSPRWAASAAASCWAATWRLVALAHSVCDPGPEIDLSAPQVEAHDLSRNTQARLRILELQQFGMSLFTGLREFGDAVQKRQLRRLALPVVLRHETPTVPGQEFTLGARGEVADQIATHEPQTMEVQDAEMLRIRASASAALPRIACHQELRARHIEWIEWDPEGVALTGVELGID